MSHTYTFIDLFAGLGGFNIALTNHGMKCVFASEIDPALQPLYTKNFGIGCQGDITKIDVKDIPKHDILCAGFPCQPFSKAGKQKGFSDQGRGEMIYEITCILQYHQPKFFILENVPNLKTHNHGESWKKIVQLLEGCNYQLQDFILSPHQFGVPHKRERIFIVGIRYDLKNIVFNFTNNSAERNSIKQWLIKDNEEKISLSDKQIECLNTWQEFIDCLPKDKPLPKFPIWAMEFGADYPLEGVSPFYMTKEKLERYKGAFGCSLRNLSKEDQLNKLPVYARYDQEKFPQWKINYINKNRDFWNTYKSQIKHLNHKFKTYINSWQKLEWNAGDEERNIFNHLLQFRSSGVRVKSNCSIPSLVLTGTQTPIIGWEKRYLTIQEAQKLQGFEKVNIDLTKSKTLSALGNAVNTFVVEEIIKQIFGSNGLFTSPPESNQIHINQSETKNKKYRIGEEGKKITVL